MGKPGIGAFRGNKIREAATLRGAGTDQSRAPLQADCLIRPLPTSPVATRPLPSGRPIPPSDIGSILLPARIQGCVVLLARSLARSLASLPAGRLPLAAADTSARSAVPSLGYTLLEVLCVSHMSTLFSRRRRTIGDANGVVSRVVPPTNYRRS
jgi:hypothetical protein